MSSGTACKCKGPRAERMKNWEVTQFKCNHSAFNGYKQTPSAYSQIHCTVCGCWWRTKSRVVYSLMAKDKFNP
jgi:phosphoribosyl 1,2-cyclic phosphodiesterase